MASTACVVISPCKRLIRSINGLETSPEFDITILMRKYYVLILTIFFISSFLSLPLYAENQNSEESLTENTPHYGLAMHGEPKYSGENTHIDYVNPNAPKGGDIKMSAIGTFDTLNPYTIKGQAPPNMNLVYDRLMRRVWDEPFTLYPLIAKSYEIASDRSWIKFTIDERAKFHDGSPITIKDIEFSFQTLREHGRPNMQRIYKLVNNTEISKDQTEIKFTFAEGYDRETALIVAMMPVLSKAWWAKHEFNATTTDAPLANGPYRIIHSDTGRKITYERVSDYWAKDLLANKGHYNFKSITYDYYRDDTIALEAFKKGDLDIRREWDIGKWNTAYADMAKNQVQYNSPHQRPERTHGFIFNTRRAPFDDINVRKALTLAFDESWVAKNLYHSSFKRIDSIFPNSSLAASQELSVTERTALMPWVESIKPELLEFKGRGLYTNEMLKTRDKIAPSPSNMRKRLKYADQLLSQAGWIVQNGVRIHRDTLSAFSFELLVSTPQEEKIALSYQRNLERLGVALIIRMADSATFQERKNSYNYDSLAFYWQNSLSPGTEQMLYWSCNAAEQQGRFNYAGICNPALDHFAAQISQTHDYETLTLNARLIDRIVFSEHIFIPLFYKNVDYIAHKNLSLIHI